MYLNPTKIIMDDNPVFAKIEDGVLYVCGDPWTMEECEEAGFVIEEATEEEILDLHRAGFPLRRLS